MKRSFLNFPQVRISICMASAGDTFLYPALKAAMEAVLRPKSSAVASSPPTERMNFLKYCLMAAHYRMYLEKSIIFIQFGSDIL